MTKATGLPEEEIERKLSKELPDYQARLDSASTVEEVIEAYRGTPVGSKARFAALEKWSDFCQEALDKAQTLEEVQNVLDSIPHGTSVELSALRKKLDLAETADIVLQVIDKSHACSEVRQEAIRKLATFFLKK